MLTCARLGLRVWSPLAGGLLSGKFGPGSYNPTDARCSNFDFPPVDRDRACKCVEVLREVGNAHGASLARVALGAKTLQQLDENLAAVELTLTPEVVARLDEVSELPVEYPGWMFSRQGASRTPLPFTKAD